MTDEVKVKVADMKWIAQTVHQGNHQDMTGDFWACPKSVCDFIARMLQAQGQKPL